MKDIIPAINRLQLACQDSEVPLANIGKIRKELMTAIRQAIMEAALAATKDTASCAVEKSPKTKCLDDFMVKFDKLNGE